MKKFIAGVVVGVCLFAGSAVFADSINLIGQKVQGVFSVEKNGSKIADAVIINGTAYAPVRAVSDAAGTKLNIEGKRIIMEEPQVVQNLRKVQALQVERNNLARQIAGLENDVVALTTQEIPLNETLAKELANNGDLGKRHAENVERAREKLAKIQAELPTLKAKLADIDAQIAAIKI